MSCLVPDFVLSESFLLVNYPTVFHPQAICNPSFSKYQIYHNHNNSFHLVQLFLIVLIEEKSNIDACVHLGEMSWEDNT